MSGIQTNRSALELPTEVSSEIIQKSQEASAVMQLARKITLPGRGVTIPMITGDPEAAWVSETGAKPVSNPTVDKKIMQAYKLAVIEPFSEEFARDMRTLYDALIARLPGVLAKKFDQTVMGAVQKPGDNFDQFSAATIQNIGTSTYDGLVAADTDISEHDGVLNGFAISPAARGILLSAKDTTGRPLFVNNVAEGAIPMILGVPTYMSRGVYKNGDAEHLDIVGIAGDWTKAMYGTVEGVRIDISKEATLTMANGSSVSLFQQNMFAIRAEIEVGFRADMTCFNLLGRTHSGGSTGQTGQTGVGG